MSGKTPEQNEANKMKSPFHHLVIRAFNTYTYSVIVSLVPLLVCTAYLTDFWTYIITTFVGMAVCFMLTYSAFWGTAERDRNLVLFGHIKEDKLRALRAALYASIPLAVLTLLYIVNVYVPFLPNWFTVAYKIFALPFLGFVMNARPPYAFLLIFICALSPLAAFLGYRNGYNLVRIMDRILYKQKPRDKDKRLR
ncbi:MAG: hypothetical protein ACOXZM_00530 [Eubacteriales bacterium]|jgi:hypothetical protein